MLTIRAGSSKTRDRKSARQRIRTFSDEC